MSTHKKPFWTLEDFDYTLPGSRIAKFPYAQRAASKVLLFDEKNLCTHHSFQELPALLPKHSALVFNASRVIPARIAFKKPTGARVEILLLEPLGLSFTEALEQKKSVSWRVLFGHAKRWKIGATFPLQVERPLVVEVAFTRKGPEEVLVEWNAGLSFRDLLEHIGTTPLPPYLGRAALPEDTQAYQTVYAQAEGSVAAPTAGLHFSHDMLSLLRTQGFSLHYVTLHVGAATFLPIKEKNVLCHRMHEEPMCFTRADIEALHAHKGNIIAIGTTSLRALESLYGYGCLLAADKKAPFVIAQDLPYGQTKALSARTISKTLSKTISKTFSKTLSKPLSRTQALEEVLESMQRQRLSELWGRTALFIRPGYTPRVCQGLFTNFHQPRSSLLMLVAALIGDRWREVYELALDKKYRFLSYGDACLFLF